MNKEKKIVKIKDDVLIGKAGDRDLLGDLFIPPDNNSNKPAIVVIHGGGWMEDFARDFVALRERPARSLREDFCGSLSNSCAWVRMHGDNTSVAVDNDAEVLQWGREELDSSYSRLDEAERASKAAAAPPAAPRSRWPDQ